MFREYDNRPFAILGGWADEGHAQGEEHLLTKMSIIFCPAGMQHMRVSIRRVDKPIFHFSVVTATKYDNRAYGE